MYHTRTALVILTCSCNTGLQAVLIFILQISNTSKCWLPLSCNLCCVGSITHELCSFLQWLLYLVSSFLMPSLSVRLTSLCCLCFDLSSFYPMCLAPWALPQRPSSAWHISVWQGLQSMEVILNSVILVPFSGRASPGQSSEHLCCQSITQLLGWALLLCCHDWPQAKIALPSILLLEPQLILGW